MTDNKIIEQIRQLLRIASDRGASINERELAQRLDGPRVGIAAS